MALSVIHFTISTQPIREKKTAGLVMVVAPQYKKGEETRFVLAVCTDSIKDGLGFVPKVSPYDWPKQTMDFTKVD